MRQVGRLDTTRADWRGWRLVERRDAYEHWIKVEGDKVHHREVYNDDPALKLAQMVRETHKPRRGDTQEAMRHQFVIPESMLATSIVEGWYADQAKWRRIVNDIDYRKLKTTDERV